MKLICGLIMLDGSDAPAPILQKMVASLSSELAPSTHDVRCAGPAGLAILDFARSPRPRPEGVVEQRRGAFLAADVRLDEAADLQRELGTGPVGDAALLAASLARWEREAPARLLGDFAFASWDPRANELLLGRDIAGVRPLVYHHCPGRHFLFASFPAAIHASGLHPRVLDEAALVRAMYMSSGATDTLSLGVSSLPPASTLCLRGGGIELREYWKLEPTSARRFKRPEEAAEELRSLVCGAVQSRLPASGPAAAHLSGGLDSSAIAVIAARRLQSEGRGLLAYSFLLEQDADKKEEDETRYVEAVLQQEASIAWTPVYPASDERDLSGARDPDFNLLFDESEPENVVCRDASARGAELVLSGWGGDEGASFNGRGMLAHALTHGNWLYMWRELRARRQVRSQGLRGILLGEILGPALPPVIRRGINRIVGRDGRSIRVTPDVIVAGPLSRERGGQEQVGTGSDLRATQLALLRSAHIPRRNAKWARIGARYGLAFAFPLLDRRILELAVSLPPTWHVRDGWRRRIYREAMQDILPPLIQWRHDKLTPFPRSRSSLLANVQNLRQAAADLERHPGVARVIDMAVVRRMVERLPDVERVGGTTFIVEYTYARIALSYASYLAQHAEPQAEAR